MWSQFPYCSMSANGMIGMENVSNIPGVKDGSSINLFIFYIDPTIDDVNTLWPDDRLEGMDILLLIVLLVTIEIS